MKKRDFTRYKLFLKMLINKKSITGPEQKRVNDIWFKVFNKTVKFTTCGSCLRDRIRNLLQEFLSEDEKQAIQEKILEAKRKRKMKY